MPIPLGIFATAGAGGGAAAAYEQIATLTGTGSSGTIIFSSIPQTYKHLQIRTTMRCTNANIRNNIFINYNGDGSSIYSRHFLLGRIGNDWMSSNVINTSTYQIANSVPGTSAPSDIHSAMVIDIADYSATTKNKTTRTMATLVYPSSQAQVELSSCVYRTNSATSTIQIIVENASFTTSSNFVLYGIRG
jgi:hypothetical protein